MDPSKAREFHGQLRENSEELNDYIRDLNNWIKDIKKTDEDLRKNRNEVNDIDYPPIRNSVEISNKKCSKSEKGNNHREESSNSNQSETEHLDSIDLRTANITEGKHRAAKVDAKETEYKKKMEKAELEKEKGNRFFKEGKYDEAITCYTEGMRIDPKNAILPANRAMAYMKKGQWTEAESDCTQSIKQDPTYVKAFHRRGTCRFSLKKYQLARQDFLKVAELDPGNKPAKVELDKLEKIFQNKQTERNVISRPEMSSEKTPPDASVVKAITKPLHLQSKKPLKRLKIELKGSEENSKKAPDKEKGKAVNTSKPRMAVTTPVKEIISPISAPQLPPVPQTAFQFLSDWKKLYKFPECQFQYIQQLPPTDIPKIFKDSMESEILCDIISVLQENVHKLGNETVYSYLQNIPAVGRFKTIVLFLSTEEKKAIKNLLKSACNGRTDTFEDLLRLYRIT